MAMCPPRIAIAGGEAPEAAPPNSSTGIAATTREVATRVMYHFTKRFCVLHNDAAKGAHHHSLSYKLHKSFKNCRHYSAICVPYTSLRVRQRTTCVWWRWILYNILDRCTVCRQFLNDLCAISNRSDVVDEVSFMEREAVEYLEERMKLVWSHKHRRSMRWTNKDIWAVQVVLKLLERVSMENFNVQGV